MQCPRCKYTGSRVIDSRPAEDNTVIRRRRECEECKHRFTTFERLERTPLLVVKRDGNREDFNREKLLRGLVRSCEKRPVSLEVLEKIVSEVEFEVYNVGESEVSTTEIGELVMDRLAKIDEIAYIRFASVYRQFTDKSRFLQELEELARRLQQ
ncbi:transcriptional repressor NrdR [Granulicatella sp. zg-ZJ]|uniref:transcriptional regulator NrdR n=1 Tax=unclassified Granulicatella TaxID=2630493 RepID=UPI0013C039B9|nr:MULTISPECIES: transcriptional regulator NrdR [unclassified Granulicatella]MBS4750617.1 transcriptional regulator NrdR [Carnobacteriaceae bacterium zg-ZUI78]NEW62870.1 transcriptional repressor NrdR [Granulicatella sp. zg-ZJ]NEW66315.1 transcriptional repressor NrdR [Granulicatella sp. zg-84]QMI85381.1 transcriptional repressor NrdR [Carnobacteriaceae bacterium zg-84]